MSENRTVRLAFKGRVIFGTVRNIYRETRKHSYYNILDKIVDVEILAGPMGFLSDRNTGITVAPDVIASVNKYILLSSIVYSTRVQGKASMPKKVKCLTHIC